MVKVGRLLPSAPAFFVFCTLQHLVHSSWICVVSACFSCSALLVVPYKRKPCNKAAPMVALLDRRVSDSETSNPGCEYEEEQHWKTPRFCMPCGHPYFSGERGWRGPRPPLRLKKGVHDRSLNAVTRLQGTTDCLGCGVASRHHPLPPKRPSRPATRGSPVAARADC